jgi:hypothetical protein
MAKTSKSIGTLCLILEYLSQKNGHSMGFDISVVKCGCMKNVTLVKKIFLLQNAGCMKN